MHQRVTRRPGLRRAGLPVRSSAVAGHGSTSAVATGHGPEPGGSCVAGTRCSAPRERPDYSRAGLRRRGVVVPQPQSEGAGGQAARDAHRRTLSRRFESSRRAGAGAAGPCRGRSSRPALAAAGCPASARPQPRSRRSAARPANRPGRRRWRGWNCSTRRRQNCVPDHSCSADSASSVKQRIGIGACCRERAEGVDDRGHPAVQAVASPRSPRGYPDPLRRS